MKPDPSSSTARRESVLSRWLSSAPQAVFSAYCIVAAFGAYFCMYGFRKPFTAGIYEGEDFLGVDYKAALIISQVIGYTLSKFIGVRVIAAMPANRRVVSVLGLIALAHGALLLFGVAPRPFNLICLFMNGLPLGMVFGLVLGFLEGRRVTEALTAGLCASFIVASGFAKTTGQLLILDYGVPEPWMPFCAAAVYWPLLIVFVTMLAHVPPPSAQDIEARAERPPMDRAARRRLLGKHGVGIALLIAIFTLLTILRSLRDDFAVELWSALGYSEEPSIFTTSELIVMLAVTAFNGVFFLIRSNRAAMRAAFAVIAASWLLILATAGLNRQELVGGYSFMVLLGLGVYVPYVAFHTTVFERLVAVMQDRSNIGFLMYLADAFGYLGYVGVLVFRKTVLTRLQIELDFLGLLLAASTLFAVISLVLTAAAAVYFLRRRLPREELGDREGDTRLTAL